MDRSAVRQVLEIIVSGQHGQHGQHLSGHFFWDVLERA
jgi:hypothetical protein